MKKIQSDLERVNGQNFLGNNKKKRILSTKWFRSHTTLPCLKSQPNQTHYLVSAQLDATPMASGSSTSSSATPSSSCPQLSTMRSPDSSAAPLTPLHTCSDAPKTPSDTGSPGRATQPGSKAACGHSDVPSASHVANVISLVTLKSPSTPQPEMGN